MTEMRRIDDPRPGFFQLRLVKGGPFVAARIWRECPWVDPSSDAHPEDWCRPLDRPRPLQAEIDGKPAEVERVWTGGRRIAASEFFYRVELGRWARAYAPEEPEANPHRPVDIRTIAIPF
jgi:hypothetical protein